MSDEWIKRNKMEKAKLLAEEHWLWLEPILHKFFVDGFIHGYKHGRREKELKSEYLELLDKCPSTGLEKEGVMKNE